MGWAIDSTHTQVYNPEHTLHIIEFKIQNENCFNIPENSSITNNITKPLIPVNTNHDCIFIMINGMPELSVDMSNAKFGDRLNDVVLCIDDKNKPAHLTFPKLYKEGAFRGSKISYISIPKSCKKIGPNAFTSTKIKSVTIARDCVYESNSFPPGCKIAYYEDT